MARKKKPPEHANHERWLISYADFITLLFAFFVVMFAVSQVDAKKLGRFEESFALAIGAPSGEHAGYLPRKDEKLPALPLSTPPPPQPVESVGDGPTPGFPTVLQNLEKVLEKRLRFDPSIKGLTVLRRGNDLVLRMSAAALFDSGEDRVKPEALPMLLAVAEEVRNKPLQVRVEGHTDDQPIHTLRFRSNWDLSTARATSVVAAVVGDGMIAPTRLMAAGYAEFQPVGANDTAEGRARNRRVDFVLSIIPDQESGVVGPPRPSYAAAPGEETAVPAPRPPAAPPVTP